MTTSKKAIQPEKEEMDAFQNDAVAGTDNAKLLAEKDAELASLKAELAKKDKLLAKKAVAAKAAQATPSLGNPKRRVHIQLFKDNGKYKEPLFVQVNDYRAQIPRGVAVEVPYFVKKHIEEMQQQDKDTALLISSYAQEFEQNKDMLT